MCNRNTLDDRVPWIPFEARRFIESILTSQSVVFEYGAGGSTLFYAQRVGQVISVEHDINWFNRVRSALDKWGIDNCILLLVPPEPADQMDGCFDPQAYCSTDESYKKYTFSRYAASIDLFPDQHFDFIAIDGRARPSCLYHARRKVKIGGYLMLDDSDRPHYQKEKKFFSGWEEHRFCGPAPYISYFKENTIWRRRCFK